MAQPTPPDPSSDPSTHLINITTFDLLLIELVPLAERMSHLYESTLDRPSPANLPNSASHTSNPPSTTNKALPPGDTQPETPLFKETLYYRLETLGHRVGQGLSERFSRDHARFADQLDVIKFLCKEVWMVVFKKQIDNLKTNHRGVFVLTDSKFRPFIRMSMANGAEAVARAQPHLVFPCGIIRGVLESLGVSATVHADTSELPTATFQIKTSTAKG